MVQLINNKGLVRFVFWWVLLFSITILTRLPHFLSPHFFIDGDEAIVGIMGNDLLNGKNFPVFFYGQNYGLSTLEVFFAAFWIKLLGSTILALKLASLSLFSLGITFITIGLQKKSIVNWKIILIISLLITFPSWTLWATYLRGGYLTAFLCCCLVFYLTSGSMNKNRHFVLLGLIAGIGFLSQMLIFFAGIMLILFFIIEEKPSWKQLVILSISSNVIILFFQLFKVENPFWIGPKLFDFSVSLETKMLYLSENFIPSYSNYFYFSHPLKIPVIWNSALIISLLLILVFIIFSFIYKMKKRIVLVFLGLLFGCLLLIFLIEIPEPRYLLGLFNLVLFYLIYVFVVQPTTLRLRIILFAIIFINTFSIGFSYFIPRQEFLSLKSESFELQQVYSKLKKDKVKTLFWDQGMMQFIWNYLYGDKIPCTAFRKTERTNDFCVRAYENYDNHNWNYAVVSFWEQKHGIDSLSGFSQTKNKIESKYCYYLNPDSMYVFNNRKW